MFDISPDDVLRLDDVQLRELVARLVAADAQAKGHSPLHVTWGGSQTAADGGLDVRADLPPTAGYCGPGLPRSQTGYQVKKPDMGRAAIIEEMRPGGSLRTVISELADLHGAYIIVSSTGTTAELRLAERRQAMREALHDCPNALQLHTDFFDRTRIATWVRNHPGLILWVRGCAGREIHGWHSFGGWSHPQGSDCGPYLLDDRLIISMGRRNTVHYTAAEAISKIRDTLSDPGQAVRLVGLSGVGKTRLVEALFEENVGAQPISKSLAVYTDLSLNPEPQPLTLATALIAQRQQAILIVDNCGSALHGELAKTCAQPNSLVSLVTVEYDVREDLPEGTQIFTMNTASISLIERLVRRRYPLLGENDAKTIAAAADGNARIALAIAGTVRASDDLTSLTNTELFDRLFWQRHEKDRSLLRAAQVLSLTYSFDANLGGSERTELVRLANLVKQDVDDILPHLADLKRRELVQQRDRWAAILPHALANHLAKRALEEVSLERIRQHIIENDDTRLLYSVLRRLSYLQADPNAIRICAALVSPGGNLADVIPLNSDKIEAYENIALVAPTEVLEAIERLADKNNDDAATAFKLLLPLIGLLAHSEVLFDRCFVLLERAAINSTSDSSGTALRILLSFFQVTEAKTNASAEMRLAYIRRWRISRAPSLVSLAEKALQKAISTELPPIRTTARNVHLLSRRSNHSTIIEFADWYRRSLEITKLFVSSDGKPAQFVRDQLTKSFAALWTIPALRKDLVASMLQCASGKFWRDGWAGCYRALHRSENDMTSEAQLRSLIAHLGPTDLTDEVFEVLLPSALHFSDTLRPETYFAHAKRLNRISEQLGRKVAEQPDVLKRLAPTLSKFGPDAYSFGQGLGTAVADPENTWKILVQAWQTARADDRNPTLLRGYISSLLARDRAATEKWLDKSLDSAALATALPALYDAIGWNEIGLSQVAKACDANVIPIDQYRYLYSASRVEPALRLNAAQLLVKIAKHSGGSAVAIDVLATWLAQKSVPVSGEIEQLRATCAAVLEQADFAEAIDPLDYSAADVATFALAGTEPESQALTQILTRRMRDTKRADALNSGCRDEVLLVMMRLQTRAVLEALYEGDEKSRNAAIRMMNDVTEDRDHQGRGLAPADLISWCEEDPPSRYDFALMIVPTIEPAVERRRMQLTVLTSTLLKRSPSPKKALTRIIERLWPQSWNGSRSTIVEVNATALDEVFGLFDDEFQQFARNAKAELLTALRVEQGLETANQRLENERFE